MHVLIVDDNPLDRAEAKAALVNGARRRYQFTEAASAAQALQLCAQAPLPDCIVLDLGLPDADGLEVLKRLPRDADQLLRVPVVVVTGSVEQGLNQAALRAGAQDYVGKAWLLPETLTQAVENAIERLRMARAFQAQRQLADVARRQVLELEGQNRQMQEANRLKSQFLANMSHELRTPLTAIIGFAELLQLGTVPQDAPRYQTFLGHIGSSGRHLLRLINDVLDLSRVESGKFEFFPEAFDLAQLVKEVLDIMQTERLRKQLRIVAHIEPALGLLTLDPARLKQVLYNYLSNAIKFTPQGGLITVRASAVGAHHVRLEVEDSGIGIAAQDLPRLFTAYQQLDAGFTKQYEGAGLGLALTRQLVAAQGGSVGVRSTLGQGSVFHVLLNRIHGTDLTLAAAAVRPPARPIDNRLLVIHPAPGDPAPAIAGSAAATFAIADVLCKPICADEMASAMARFQLPGGGTVNVMVVDHDPMALDLMRATLQAMGIDAVCLLDGREALRDLDLHRPDAIILALVLPVFDAFAVLDALQRLPAWRDTPVFLWTDRVLTDGEHAVLGQSARALLRQRSAAPATQAPNGQRL